ncbi:MAG: hypothetical protein PHX62_08025 [Bacilli bacterium]|nr:hypothetical protein [Bacilli bacterium]
MNDLIQKYMDDPLLYFYSTIPQIIAAIIAFIFVFVIFKLQDYDKIKQVKCFNFNDELGTYLSSFSNKKKCSGDLLHSIRSLHTQYSIGYFKDISDLMAKICEEFHNKKEGEEGHPKSIITKLETITDNTRIIDEVRESLISRSIWICLYGFVLIIGSIVVLYFVKSIFLKPCLSLVLFIFFIVSASVFFALVFRLLVVSLKNQENVRYIFNVCKTFPYIKIIKKPIMITFDQFMHQNIESCKGIIRNISDHDIINDRKAFDSERFIDNFAKRFKSEYNGFISQYKVEPERNVKAQIEAFLKKNKDQLGIIDRGTMPKSPYTGKNTQTKIWEKID